MHCCKNVQKFYLHRGYKTYSELSRGRQFWFDVEIDSTSKSERMVASNLSRSLMGIFSKVSQSLPVKATVCFIALYSYLIIVAIPLLLLFIYRLILSFVFKIFYQGKLKLAKDFDAVVAAIDTPANVTNITFYIYIDGHCNIEKLRKRISTRILTRDENGKRPYQILLNSIVEKFGFPCFMDKSDTIDFKNHIKLLPGSDDKDRVYNEHEFLDAVTNLADDMWDESKPRWELLITPKVKREDSEKISTGIALKFHHAYIDGISLVQFLRNCVFDQPPPKFTLDPVNPAFPRVPLYKKILMWLQVLFLGPFTSLRVLANGYDPIMSEGPLTGGKLFGRTKMKIPLEMMRRIRKFHKCSTQDVFQSAFIGSFQKMAERKWISLPNEIYAGLVMTEFPYADESPRNNLVLGIEPVPISTTNPIYRLAQIKNSMGTLQSRIYEVKTSRILLKLLGMYPAALLKISATFFKMSYYVSNVPGLQEVAKIDGKDVVMIYGCGHLYNRIRYHAGVGFYGGSFCVGLYLEASKIISNREELEEWIREYENEIRFLDTEVSAS